MADVDIDPFGEHESRPEEPTDECIPLDPVTPGGSTWEPTHEQETSLGGRESQRTKLMKDYVKDLYKKLSENIGETPEPFYYNYFKLEGGELYYIGSRKPLTTEGKLKLVGMIADILGKNRLHRLGFNIPVGKITAQQIVMLNKAAEELLSETDITRMHDIELQEIAEKAMKSTEDLISHLNDQQSQTDELFEHPLHELLGLDKQLRSNQGSLKVEVAKSSSWKSALLKSIASLRNSENIPEFTMTQ